MTKKHKKSWANKLTVLGLFLTLLLAPCFACLAKDYFGECGTLLDSGQGYAVFIHYPPVGSRDMPAIMADQIIPALNGSKAFLLYNPQFAGCAYYHGPNYGGPTKAVYEGLLKSTRTHGPIYDFSCAGTIPDALKCRGSTVGAGIMLRPVIQAAPGHLSSVGLIPSAPGLPKGPFFCVTTERVLGVSIGGKGLYDSFSPTRVQVVYPDGRIKVVPAEKTAYLFGPDTVLRGTDGAFIRGKNRAYDIKRLAQDPSICSTPQIRQLGGVKRAIGGVAFSPLAKGALGAHNVRGWIEDPKGSLVSEVATRGAIAVASGPGIIPASFAAIGTCSMGGQAGVRILYQHAVEEIPDVKHAFELLNKNARPTDGREMSDEEIEQFYDAMLEP